MKPNLTHPLIVILIVGLLGTTLVGCGGHKSSPKADSLELEQAFGLKAGAQPSDEAPPAGRASRAVAAIRAQDWVKSLALLEQLRRVRDLTAAQMQAVHNAQGNANVRMVELAAKGNADAKAALDRSKREADAR